MTYPVATKLPTPKVLYKPYQKGNKDFLDRFGLSQMEKQRLRQQIGQISVTHQLDSKTLNIPSGKEVKQIIVLEIQLLQESIDLEILATLDTHLGFYSLFELVYPDGKRSTLIHFKQKRANPKDGRNYKIIRSFQIEQELELDYQERDLDVFYENLVQTTGQATLVGSDESNLQERIQQTDQLAKLETEAQKLEKKMFAEKSMRKQMEWRKQLKQVKAQIDQLKNG